MARWEVIRAGYIDGENSVPLLTNSMKIKSCAEGNQAGSGVEPLNCEELSGRVWASSGTGPFPPPPR